jgi:hypothetical protein
MIPMILLIVSMVGTVAVFEVVMRGSHEGQQQETPAEAAKAD